MYFYRDAVPRDEFRHFANFTHHSVSFFDRYMDIRLVGIWNLLSTFMMIGVTGNLSVVYVFSVRWGTRSTFSFYSAYLSGLHVAKCLTVAPFLILMVQMSATGMRITSFLCQFFWATFIFYMLGTTFLLLLAANCLYYQVRYPWKIHHVGKAIAKCAVATVTAMVMSLPAFALYISREPDDFTTLFAYVAVKGSKCMISPELKNSALAKTYLWFFVLVHSVSIVFTAMVYLLILCHLWRLSTSRLISVKSIAAEAAPSLSVIESKSFSNLSVGMQNLTNRFYHFIWEQSETEISSSLTPQERCIRETLATGDVIVQDARRTTSIATKTPFLTTGSSSALGGESFLEKISKGVKELRKDLSKTSTLQQVNKGETAHVEEKKECEDHSQTSIVTIMSKESVVDPLETARPISGTSAPGTSLIRLHQTFHLPPELALCTSMEDTCHLESSSLEGSVDKERDGQTDWAANQAKPPGSELPNRNQHDRQNEKQINLFQLNSLVSVPFALGDSTRQKDTRNGELGSEYSCDLAPPAQLSSLFQVGVDSPGAVAQDSSETAESKQNLCTLRRVLKHDAQTNLQPLSESPENMSGTNRNNAFSDREFKSDPTCMFSLLHKPAPFHRSETDYKVPEHSLRRDRTNSANSEPKCTQSRKAKTCCHILFKTAPRRRPVPNSVPPAPSMADHYSRQYPHIIDKSPNELQTASIGSDQHKGQSHTLWHTQTSRRDVSSITEGGGSESVVAEHIPTHCETNPWNGGLSCPYGKTGEAVEMWDSSVLYLNVSQNTMTEETPSCPQGTSKGGEVHTGTGHKEQRCKCADGPADKPQFHMVIDDLTVPSKNDPPVTTTTTTKSSLTPTNKKVSELKPVRPRFSLWKTVKAERNHQSHSKSWRYSLAYHQESRGVMPFTRSAFLFGGEILSFMISCMAMLAVMAAEVFDLEIMRIDITFVAYEMLRVLFFTNDAMHPLLLITFNHSFRRELMEIFFDIRRRLCC